MTSDVPTSEDVTTALITTENVTTQPVTTEIATTAVITTEPVTTELVTTKPVTTTPITTKPVTTKLVTTLPVTTVPVTTLPVTTVPVTKSTPDSLDKHGTKPKNADFVNVAEYIPSVHIDIRYGTDRNPTGIAVYRFKDAYLRYATVVKLARVQDELLENGYSLLIWDAYRPLSAQAALYLVSPENASAPSKYGTPYNRGIGLSVSLVKSDGTPVPMPCDFETADRLSDRNFSDCSEAEAQNAALLISLMKKYGFETYLEDWWRFRDKNSYSQSFLTDLDASGKVVPEVWTTECNEYVSMLSTPSIDGNVICNVPKGKTFYLLAFRDAYALVYYEGKVGYMRAGFIKPYNPDKDEFRYVDPRADYTYDQLTIDLAEIAGAYPELVTLSSIGKSVEGRDLWLIQVGNPSAETKIMIQATIHAREYICTSIVMAQLDYMLAHQELVYAPDRTVADVLQDTCYYIVPMSNPDGVTIVQTGIIPGGLTGVSTLWKSNANGVDLNRNFDAGWNKLKNGTDQPGQEMYKGTKPESEPESKALADFVRENDFDLILSYHSTGSLIYWKFGDYAINDINKRIGLMIGSTMGYRIAFQDDLSSAGFKDWATMQGIASLTIEFGTMTPPNKIQDFENCWTRSKNVLLYCSDCVKGYIEK